MLIRDRDSERFLRLDSAGFIEWTGRKSATSFTKEGAIYWAARIKQKMRINVEMVQGKSLLDEKEVTGLER